MVRPFQFSRIPKIYFGNGKLSELPKVIKSFGTSVILVTGNKSFSHSPYSDLLLNALADAGIKHHMVTISEEPSPGKIDEVVRTFRNEDINLVVGIGGGSVLDAGKAISAMMYKTEPVKDFLEGVGMKDHPGTKIPYIAVPTTSGTGSEATKNSVLSEIGKDGFKKSLRHDNLVPEVALVDPSLTLSCAADITASTGMDCFTQLVESYLSDKSNPYTDALAVEGLREIKSSLSQSYHNGSNLEARTGMSFAALTSGICLGNAGLGAVHGFASSLGGILNIPHGVICGTLMAVSNEINIRELRRSASNPAALKKYAFLGELFIGAEKKSDEFYINGLINYLHELTDELNLPGLRKYGLDENEIRFLCLETEIKNNPVKLAPDDLAEILLRRS